MSTDYCPYDPLPLELKRPIHMTVKTEEKYRLLSETLSVALRHIDPLDRNDLYTFVETFMTSLLGAYLRMHPEETP